MPLNVVFRLSLYWLLYTGSQEGCIWYDVYTIYLHTWITPISLCLSEVSVGFEYESCLDLILWEKRTAILQGYELDASNMGGWTLDRHHVLDVQNGEPTSNLWLLRRITQISHSYTDFNMRSSLILAISWNHVFTHTLPNINKNQLKYTCLTSPSSSKSGPFSAC